MNKHHPVSGKIDTVLFDLGGVLVHLRWAKAWRRAARDCPGWRAWRAWRACPPQCVVCFGRGRNLQVVKDYEAGQADWDEVANWFRARTGFAGSAGTLRDTWCSVFEENGPMIRFAGELAQDYRLFYLSNIGREHLRYLHDHFPFMDLFQGGAASCDLGVCKPEEGFFEKALKRLELEPQECVFVDDREENVTAARKYGLMAVHHRKVRETIREVGQALA